MRCEPQSQRKVDADVSAAEVTSEAHPGSYAAGTSATTEETRSEAPVVTAVPAVKCSVAHPGSYADGTSASTLEAEPVAGSTPESPAPTYAPASTPQPDVEVTPTASVVAADVSAAEVTSEAHPGSYAADTSLRQGYVGQAAATTEQTRSEASVVTAVPAVVYSEAPPDSYADGTSASTLEAEPVAGSTPESPAPTYAPASTPQPDVEVTPSISEVAADVPALTCPELCRRSGVEGPAAEVTSEAHPSTYAADTSLRQGYVGQAAATTEQTRSEAPVVTAVPAVECSVAQPGSYADGTSASTLVSAPVVEPTTETPPPTSTPAEKEDLMQSREINYSFRGFVASRENLKRLAKAAAKEAALTEQRPPLWHPSRLSTRDS